MSIAVNKTKINVPRRRPDLLSRSRLNSILVDLLDYPFTLISAPAGYGKTSLMIDLAHLASYPVCWYTIDSLDRDPKRFLAHFIHAIKMEFPSLGKPSLNLLYNLNDPLDRPDQFVSTLVQDIYKTISENFVIFLDDYNLLNNQSQINRFISCFGKQMDENTHLVISSRNLFSFPDLPLMIGRKQVLGVDQNDLAFQPQELQEYFQEHLNKPISDIVSKKMIDSTAGWITGLLLSKDNTPSIVPAQNKAARVTGANLDSYFTDQVFQKQSPIIQNMMLRTSLFEEFDSDFCRDFFGGDHKTDWPNFINSLTENNLFVEEVEENGIWVRYHHLFRDFLNRELENQLPGEKEQILIKLIENHILHKNWEQAYDAAFRLNDSLQMAKVINISFGPLFHAGRIRLLSSWLENLPEEGFNKYPILSSLKGFTSTELGNPSLGLSEINSAINKQQIKNNKFLLAKSLVWRSTSHRLLGNYDIGINDSFLSLATISNKKHLHDIQGEAFREIGLGYGRLGNNFQAYKYLKKSIEQYRIAKKSNNLSQVKIDIGHVCINMGKFGEAETYFRETIPHWQEQGNNVQLSNLMNNLGYLSMLKGSFSEASQWLIKGEEHAKLASSKRMLSFIVASRGDLARSIGLFMESINFYNEAQLISLNSPDSFLEVYIPIAKATSLRYSNNLKECKDLLKILKEIILHRGSTYELGLWHIEWGFNHLAQNSFDTALDSFNLARDIFNNISRPYEHIKSVLGLCLVSYCQHSFNSHKKFLNYLLNIVLDIESFQPLLPEFIQHQDKIKEITSNLPNQNQLHQCIVEMDQYLHKIPKFQKNLFPPSNSHAIISQIEIQGFGEIEVTRDGDKITSSEWVHQKTVREILFYLLSHPQGVTKDQLGLAIWPDSSPGQLSCQFKNAIYRLRRAIGSDYIKYNQERRKYSFNRLCNYTYDVEQFEKAIQKASNFSIKEDKIEQLRRAITLYKHPFAPQIDGIWVEPVRRNLFLSYEKALLEIADFDLLMKKYTSCKEACFTLLNIEPYQEQVYQLGMKALKGLNDLTGIHRLYQRCHDNFHTLLGIRPSRMTTNLYKELTSN